MRKKMRPVHPGELLKKDLFEPNNLTLGKAAELLMVSRVTLSKICNRRSDITPEMACRISLVFGGTPELWINLQTKYNLQIAEERIKKLKLKKFQKESH